MDKPQRCYPKNTIKILIFTEGTVIMHASAKGKNREERVKQVENNDPSIHDFKNYIPNGESVKKIQSWKNHNAEIHYLTSRTSSGEIDQIKNVLEKYNFPDSQNLHFRRKGENYKDIAENLLPNVLIEDDCESIGGEFEMTYPHIKEEFKNQIKSIVIKEFDGIDCLPDTIDGLLNY